MADPFTVMTTCSGYDGIAHAIATNPALKGWRLVSYAELPSNHAAIAVLAYKVGDPAELNQGDIVYALGIPFPGYVVLYFAGTPCLDISRANLRKPGIGSQWTWLQIEAIKHARRCGAKIIVLENSDDLLRTKRFRPWLNVVLNTFRRWGYSPRARVIDASAFGSSNRRARTYLVASWAGELPVEQIVSRPLTGERLDS